MYVYIRQDISLGTFAKQNCQVLLRVIQDKQTLGKRAIKESKRTETKAFGKVLALCVFKTALYTCML